MRTHTQHAHTHANVHAHTHATHAHTHTHTERTRSTLHAHTAHARARESGGGEAAAATTTTRAAAAAARAAAAGACGVVGGVRVSVCVSGAEGACAWVGKGCVRMRGCGVGLNRSDSPVGPPAQRRATLLAMARRIADHWHRGGHTAELCDQQRQRRNGEIRGGGLLRSRLFRLLLRSSAPQPPSRPASTRSLVSKCTAVVQRT